MLYVFYLLYVKPYYFLIATKEHYWTRSMKWLPTGSIVNINLKNYLNCFKKHTKVIDVVPLVTTCLVYWIFIYFKDTKKKKRLWSSCLDVNQLICSRQSLLILLIIKLWREDLPNKNCYQTFFYDHDLHTSSYQHVPSIS